MVYEMRNGSGIDALSFNQLSAGVRGDGVVVDLADLPDPETCRPTLGDSRATISVDIAEGAVVINGNTHGVAPSTVALDDGGEEPRRDIVYAAEGGSVHALKGTPGAPATDEEGTPIEGAAAPLPSSPDMADVTGTPLAVVWVPAHASGGIDLDPERDLWDRRIPVTDPGRLVQFRETIAVSELAAGDARSTYLPVRPGADIRMYEWGIGYLLEAQPGASWASATPPEGVYAEIVGPTGSVVHSTQSERARDSPLFTIESDASLADPIDYWLRIRNGTGADITAPNGVAGTFVFEVGGP